MVKYDGAGPSLGAAGLLIEVGLMVTPPVAAVRILGKALGDENAFQGPMVLVPQDTLPTRNPPLRTSPPIAPDPDIKSKILSGNAFQVSGDEEVDDELTNLDFAFKQMRQLEWYNALTGPNSNTYARQLLVNAGFTVPSILPFQTPGWTVYSEYRYDSNFYDRWGYAK